MFLLKIPIYIWNAIKTSFGWYFGLYRNSGWLKKIWIAFMSFVMFIAFYIFAVLTNFLWLFGDSPSLSEIMAHKSPVASTIISADGQTLSKVFNENRTLVPYDSIAPVFFDALISTEDKRFYTHNGIDLKGLGGAIKDAIAGNSRGASTITQQLVKNKFGTRSKYGTGLLGKIPGLRILVMKSKEIILAVGLEMYYSKEEILTMYANTVDFGSDAFGINTAAKTYFGTTPLKLKTEEAAVLVGLLKATNTYNPNLHPEKSLERRNVVLGLMLENNKISQSDYDRIIRQKKIKLHFEKENQLNGNALYFRQAVLKELQDKLPGYDPYVDGLKIHTTLDSRMQEYAKRAVWRNMQSIQTSAGGVTVPERRIKELVKKTSEYKRLAALYPGQSDSVNYYLNKKHRVRLFDYGATNHERYAQMSTIDSLRYMLKFMHIGFVAIEPTTGHVKAYLGDVDYKTWQYDKVMAPHQPGSTFKLFVYTTAMKRGKTPNDSYLDAPLRVDGKDWPQNAGGHYSGQYLSLRSAFARSVNTVAARIGHEMKTPNVAATAHDMGIKSELNENLAMCLGASEVTPFELVSAYGTIANGGEHVEPVLVDYVEDSEGRVVYRASQESTSAVSIDVAQKMRTLLSAGAHDPGGTSTKLGGYIGSYATQLDYGGKTGTTNDKADAWFVGVTPNLVAGAWIGGEYNFVRAGGYGGTMVLPIIGEFLQRVMGNPAINGKYLRKYDRGGKAISTTVPTKVIIDRSSDEYGVRQGEGDVIVPDAVPDGAGEDANVESNIESRPPEVHQAPAANTPHPSSHPVPQPQQSPAPEKKSNAAPPKPAAKPQENVEHLFD